MTCVIVAYLHWVTRKRKAQQENDLIAVTVGSINSFGPFSRILGDSSGFFRILQDLFRPFQWLQHNNELALKAIALLTWKTHCLSLLHTHTHTHTHIYIYIYIVSNCFCFFKGFSHSISFVWSQIAVTRYKTHTRIKFQLVSSVFFCFVFFFHHQYCSLWLCQLSTRVHSKRIFHVQIDIELLQELKSSVMDVGDRTEQPPQPHGTFLQDAFQLLWKTWLLFPVAGNSDTDHAAICCRSWPLAQFVAVYVGICFRFQLRNCYCVSLFLPRLQLLRTIRNIVNSTNSVDIIAINKEERLMAVA